MVYFKLFFLSLILGLLFPWVKAANQEDNWWDNFNVNVWGNWGTSEGADDAFWNSFVDSSEDDFSYSGEDFWNASYWENYTDYFNYSDNWFNSSEVPSRPSPAPEPQPIIPMSVPPAVPSSCGQTKFYFHASNPIIGSAVRVVGGRQTEPNTFPWLARLADGSGNTQCGASVIDKDWVLTAAHCVGRSRIYAHFGDHDTRNTDIGEIRMVIRPNRIYPHSDYNDDTMDFDFALLKLPSSLTFSDKVQPVCLPRGCGDGCDKAGQAASIHGWGDLKEGGRSPNILQEATVFIRSFDSCQRSYSGEMTEHMLCAGVQGGGVDTCQGDSGGPFVINEDGFNKLCGVVSWGYGCARPESPGVYAKVCTVLNWIQTTMRSN